jgi:hypothetical protein
MPKIELTPLQMKAMRAAKARMASALSLYRPTPQQEEVIRAFSRDECIELLLGGGNRAGKSLVAAAILTSAITGEPITFNDGSKHKMTPEHWDDEPLTIWIFGFDWKHIAINLHRLLILQGAFRVVKEDGKMRPVDPTKDPKRVRKPAPPFINAAIDILDGEEGIAWEDKKKNEISSFTMNNGTRVTFFPSTGAIPQGVPVHIIWIDERIDREKMYSECQARLVDNDGKMIWTSWPDVEPSEAMSALEDRANEQKGKPDQFSFAFCLKGGDNPYVVGKRRDNIMSTMDADTRLARDEGIMNKDRWRIYPRFSKHVHCVFQKDPANDDLLAKTIRSQNGIPATFTRYLILDPGTANPAVLFVAIPPPHIYGDFIVPYDELYLHYTSAEPLAKAVAGKAGIVLDEYGQVTQSGQMFEEFIADFRACRQTPAGFDGTIGQNYEKYFAKSGLRCRRRGSTFSAGSDNPEVRQMGVQGTMNLRSDSKPCLRIMVDSCPNLVSQLENYRRGKDPKGNPTDKAADYQRIDLAQTLEYLVSRHDCRYVPPAAPTMVRTTPRELAMKDINKLFGRTSDKRPADQSVYCGAGSISDTPFS